MKKMLLFLPLFLFATLISAQCDDLFISEYVEGYGNNKSLEIYNPTDAAINLSGYSLVRFSNGATTANDAKILPLPNTMLEAKGVYIAVIDKQDQSQVGTQNTPTWNGLIVVDTLFDFVTGEVVLDDDGNVIIGPQFNDDGTPIYGTEYNTLYDLQCKADNFFCPIYDDNNTMYFNGNDAVALITGTTVAADASNLVDVVGVIGEDPAAGAWVNSEGSWLTKDRTLVRKAEVQTGRKALDEVAFQLGGTFMGEEWEAYNKNSFQFLGVHNSTCDNNASEDDDATCAELATSTNNLNLVPFSMAPNPSSGSVNIEAGVNIETISVFNFLGQRMFSQKVGNGSTTTSLNLYNYSSGMYLIDITFEGDQRSIQKLIIE